MTAAAYDGSMSTSSEANIAELTQQIEADPANASLYFARAAAWHRLDNNTAAVADYDKAFALGLSTAELLSDRAVALLHLGDENRALVGFTAAILADPRFALAYINRGDLYAKRGEPEKAHADYQAVIDFVTEDLAKTPDDGHTLALRGAAYNRDGQLDAALADLNRAAELSPDYSKTFRHRGEVLLKLGHKKEALADFDRVLKTDSHNPIVIALRERCESH